MAVNKVDLYVSQIKDLLDQGYTWLEKDNLGYGSIESKYGANAVQIAAIRKHPKLKDLETNITIFNVIDDIDETINKTKESKFVRSSDSLDESILRMETPESKMGNVNTSADTNAANIFAQL